MYPAEDLWWNTGCPCLAPVSQATLSDTYYMYYTYTYTYYVYNTIICIIYVTHITRIISIVPCALVWLLYLQPLNLTQSVQTLISQPVSIGTNQEVFFFCFVRTMLQCYSVPWLLSGPIWLLSAWEICRLNKWPESLKWRNEWSIWNF